MYWTIINYVKEETSEKLPTNNGTIGEIYEALVKLNADLTNIRIGETWFMKSEEDQLIDDLYKILAPQVDVMLMEDELSRARNQRYLDRIAYRECACGAGGYNDFDLDSYDDAQLFFERQHKIR